MSVDLKNSETLKNLMRAFAGESQARNRYTFAASVCRQQKLHVVEAVFRFTADQEKEHAEIFYNHMKELAGQTVAIDGTYPVDLTNDVKELLRKAQHNEYEEHDRYTRPSATWPSRRAFPLWRLPSTRSQRSSRPMATASAGWRICWNRESCLSPMSSAPGCA